AALGLAAALNAAPALAAVQTWNFDSSSQSFSSTSDGNTLSLTSSDGINLVVSGWSDTSDITGPDTIQTAELIWAQSGALGVVNRDEGTTSPDHSVDSYSSDSDGEYDMLLLTFDTAVNLTDVNFSWARDGSVSDQADVSLVAYSGVGDDTLNGKTWGDVLTSGTGGFNVVDNYANIPLGYYAVNGSDVVSTQWLIGAYNPVFGGSLSDYGDGFKLSAIRTSTDDPPPPNDVPVPGSLPLVLLGLYALRNRMLR
ncbi:MAG: hypothetical protein HKN19_08850, partial [Halioglobus sp.]|nr:hypothetical protein [Halioglobus sp.]